MAGYMRLRQICLVAPKLEPVISDIAAIMGLNECYRDGNVAKYGLENALLPVDTILLEVVAPFKPGTAAGRFIDKSGGGGGLNADFFFRRPGARGPAAHPPRGGPPQGVWAAPPPRGAPRPPACR